MNAVAQLTPAQTGRRRLDRERRQRRAGRGARRARSRRRARRCWSWTARRRPSSRPSSGSAPRSSRRPSTKCWKAVEAHQSDRMTGRLVHPFDDDDFISGNGTAALEILEDLPGRRRRRRADGRRRPARPASAVVDARAAADGARSTRPSRRTRRRCRPRSRPARPARFDELEPLVGRRRRRPVGAATRCGRSSRSTSTSRSSSRSTTRRRR